MNLYFIFKQITPTKILINKIDGLLFLCLQWRGISSKFQTSHFCWINYYRGNWEEFIWVRQMGIIQIYNSKPPMIFKWRKKVSNFPLLLDQLSEGFIWVRHNISRPNIRTMLSVATEWWKRLSSSSMRHNHWISKGYPLYMIQLHGGYLARHHLPVSPCQ